VYDQKGRERTIKNLDEDIVLRIWANLDDKEFVSCCPVRTRVLFLSFWFLFFFISFLFILLLPLPLSPFFANFFLTSFQENGCVGFTTDGKGDWECLDGFASEGGGNDTIYIKSKTNHLTSVLLLLLLLLLLLRLPSFSLPSFLNLTLDFQFLLCFVISL
jgi:hypothetical protein